MLAAQALFSNPRSLGMLFSDPAHDAQVRFIPQVRLVSQVGFIPQMCLILAVQTHPLGISQRMMNRVSNDPATNSMTDHMPMHCGWMHLSGRMHSGKGRKRQRERQQSGERGPEHGVLRREKVVEHGQNTEAMAAREVPFRILAPFGNFFGNGSVTARSRRRTRLLTYEFSQLIATIPISYVF
jgi:hypothetical protein